MTALRNRLAAATPVCAISSFQAKNVLSALAGRAWQRIFRLAASVFPLGSPVSRSVIVSSLLHVLSARLMSRPGTNDANLPAHSR